MIVKFKIALSLALIGVIGYGLFSDKVTGFSLTMAIALLIVLWID